MDYTKICSDALERYGIVSQVGMMEEEMNELSIALHHFQRGRATVDEVITEIADVAIMVYQMALLFGKEGVDKEVERKLQRLEKKLSRI